MRPKWASLVFASATLLSCVKDGEPIDPVWGKEPCAHCAMLVGDKRHAAQAIEHGDRHFFDDVGCLVLWTRTHQPSKAWVRDATSDRWLEAKTARYDGGAKTPMDFGFEARGDGAAIGWDEMRDRVIAKEETGR